MNKLVYLKVLVLLAALCGVIYVINHMSAEKVSQGMEKVGIAVPAATPGSAPTGESVTLCRTRVHAIIWPDGRKIEEARDGMKARWQAYNLTPQDIGSMDIEKWLSLHCEVAAVARDASSASQAKPFVSFEYIDKGRENLDRSADGVYRFAGRSFTSPDLDTAFADLIKLANLQPTGP